MQDLLNDQESPLNNNLFWEREKMEYLDSINTLNQKMKDLSWIQTNFVRDPVFRIKCIISLMQERKTDKDYLESMLTYLTMSVKELDSSLKYLQEMTELSAGTY